MKKFLHLLMMALLLPSSIWAQNKAIKFLATQSYAINYIKPQGDDRLEIPETLLTDRDPAGEDIWVDINTSFTFSGWFNLYDWYQFSKTSGSGLLMIGQRVHANNNPSLGLMVLRPADYSTSNKRGNGGILKLLCADSSNSSVAGDITGDNATLNLDEWFYLTLVYDKDSQEIRVYKDGNLLDSRKLPNPLRLLPDVPGILYTGSFAMNGMCDELQFWTKALTDAEVQTAYYNADAVSGLDLWYDFNEATASEEGASETAVFLNKATSEKGQGINATYYHVAASKTSYSGFITNLTSFTEKTPELVDGREIQALPSYTITVPEVANGTLTVTNGTETLAAGTHPVTVGSNLTITAEPAEGYALSYLKFGGEYIASGSTVTVSNDAAIELLFTNSFHTLSIVDTEADYTLTTLNGIELNPTSIPAGTEIKLTVNGWPKEKTLKQVTVNGTPIEAAEDGSYIFTVESDTELNIELRNLENFTVTYRDDVPHGLLSVTDAQEAIIRSGATVLEGSTLTITAKPDSGYDILLLCVNGEDFESGANVTVSGNINIEYEFAEAVAYIPGRQKNGSSNHLYSFRFSESVLGARENNTCDDPAEVGTTDHRARSFTYSAWLKPTNLSVSGKDPKGRLMGDIQEGMTGTDGAFSVALEDGKLVLRARVYKTATEMPGINALVTDTELALNEWAFLSVVADNEAKTLSLYKNGQLCGTIDTSKDNDGNEAYGIGLLPDASSFYAFDFSCAGYLEDVQVWTKALTPREIKLSTRQGKADEGLVAWFRPRKGDQIIPNYGSEKETTAAMFAGFYTSGKWTIPKEQVIFDAGAAHNPERVSITAIQPTDNIGTFSIIGEEGRAIDNNAYLYESINVDLTNIDGATVTGITVTGNGEPITYTLNELPFVVESDVEISLNYDVVNTIMFNYTGEHGKITLKVNDEEPVEVTEPIEIPKNATLEITAIPDEHYELTVASINGEKIFDRYEYEDSWDDDEPDFYDNVYTYQAGERNIDLNLTFNLVRCWLWAEVYNTDYSDIAGDDTDLYPAFSDREGTTIDEDSSNYIPVPYGTEVSLCIWSVPSDSYGENGFHNIISKVWDYRYDTGETIDVTNLLESVPNGEDEDRIYHLGAVTCDHYFFIYQDLYSGIATIGADANSLIKVVDGIISVTEEATIEVTDMNGRTVARANGTQLNIKELVKGVYVAKATTATGTNTLKFIKF